MRDLTIDFESYFDTEVSLKKLPTLLYVRHPKFRVHGAAIKEGEAPARWLTHPGLTDYFATLDWREIRAISHNANFDLLVLHEHYGVTPGQRVDTLGLCRALLPRDLDFDLGSICRLLGLGEKLDDSAALNAVKGIERPGLEQLEQLGHYAAHDAELCYRLYRMLYPSLPGIEPRFMNLIVRLSTQGVFENSAEAQAALEAAKQEIVDDRAEKLAACGVDITTLRSRDKFAELLRARGVEPPIKTSATTGRPTYAFAKQDPEYVALQADERVADLVNARMAVASNNALSRIDSLAKILALPPHTLPVCLNLSGAHTHRLSGGGKINMQNLNARGLGKGIRRGIRVRDGYRIMVYDQNAIELRMNMLFSGQLDVLAVMAAGGDVYVQEAAAQFGIPEDRVDAIQRLFGKVIRLGAQYGMGPPRFRHYVATGPLGLKPMYISDAQAFETIYTYRRNHPRVVESWDWLNNVALPHMAAKGARPLQRGPIQIEFEQIRLPGGLCLSYPNLQATEDGWVWGYKAAHRPWGGIIQENIVQALTGQLMKEQMLAIDDALGGDTFMRHYQRAQFGSSSARLEADIARRLAGHAAVAHQVHDEILIVCREADAEAISREVERLMVIPPAWYPQLPLKVEGGWAQEYSK